MFDPAQFQRKADFRGVYPNQVNEELAWFAGRYLVRALKAETKTPAPHVLVGRDGRCSSTAIYSAFIQGIAVEGGVPLPCGLTTTDMIQWGTGSQQGGAIAGAMITASHNPPEYNGIKMVLRNAQSNSIDMLRPADHLQSFYLSDGDQTAAPAAACVPFPAAANLKLDQKFAKAACERAPRLKQATGKIVLDPGNGVGGMLVPLMKQMLAEVGSKVEVHAVAENIDGTFPTRPSNPGLPGAVKLLQQKVLELGANFGAAFDGDADRVFLVDEWGQFVQGSTLLAALAQGSIRKAATKSKEPPKVITVAVASWLVIETIRKAGGTPILSKVGQDSIKEGLIKTGAIFGGESSAHYDFPDAYGIDSGLFALMTFWEMLLESGKSCSQLLGELNPWPNSGEINLKVESPDWKVTSAAVMKMLQERFGRPEENCYIFTIDGVSAFHPKIDKFATADDLFQIDKAHEPTGKVYRVVQPGYDPQWWFNVRASNNEPLLRLNVEARSLSDVTGRTYGLISTIREFCQKQGANVQVQDWGNLK